MAWLDEVFAPMQAMPMGHRVIYTVGCFYTGRLLGFALKMILVPGWRLLFRWWRFDARGRTGRYSRWEHAFKRRGFK